MFSLPFLFKNKKVNVARDYDLARTVCQHVCPYVPSGSYKGSASKHLHLYSCYQMRWYCIWQWTAKLVE